MALEQHASVYLFTMEGCGHCEALKAGSPSKIKQIESICSRGCQHFKHFHLIDGKLNPRPLGKHEKAAAAKVNGYPTIVTCLGNDMQHRAGGDEIDQFINAFKGVTARRCERRGTPFGPSSVSVSQQKKRRSSGVF